MNEKITEIAKKAGITFKPMMIDGEEYSYQHVHLNDYTKGVEDEAGCIKLFAELLIKECVEVLQKEIKKAIAHDGVETNIDLILIDHFGIE